MRRRDRWGCRGSGLGRNSRSGDGAATAYRDTRENLRILRRETGDPHVPIHLIGGGTDQSDLSEGRAFTRAINRFGAMGASLYSHAGTSAEDWQAITGLRFQDPAPPLPSRSWTSGI